MNSSTAIEETPWPPNTPKDCSSAATSSTRTVPDAPAPLRGLRTSGNPACSANARASAALLTAAEAAGGTPAEPSASFIDGLYRDRHGGLSALPVVLQAHRAWV